MKFPRRRVLQSIGIGGLSGIATAGFGSAGSTPRAPPSEGETGGDVDVFSIGGQSNAEGRGDLARSPTVRADVALEYDAAAGAVEPLSDPVAESDHGSAWPAFANRYHELTDRRLAFVESADGGSAMSPGADLSGSNWDELDELPEVLVTEAHEAVSALEGEGYSPRYRGVLWSQGERDAHAIDAGNTTVDAYESSFREVLEYFEEELPDASGTFLFETAHDASGDTTGYERIRRAQAKLCREREDLVYASGIQKTFPRRGLMADSVHYDQDGLNEMGRFGGTAVAQYVLREE